MAGLDVLPNLESPSKKADDWRDGFCLAVGWLFLFWWAADLFIAFFLNESAKLSVLWFCNISIGLFAIGILFRLPGLLVAVYSYVAFIQPLWIADFTWRTLFGLDIIGDTTFMFEKSFLFVDFLNMFSHFLLLPLGLLVLLRIARPIRSAYLVAICYALILLPLSYLLSDAPYNLNCAYTSCGRTPSLGLEGAAYLLFFLAAIICIGLAACFFVSAALRRYSSSPHKKAIGRRIWGGIAAYFAFVFVIYALGIIKYFSVTGNTVF